MAEYVHSHASEKTIVDLVRQQVFGSYIFLFNFAYTLIVAFDSAGYVDLENGADVIAVTVGVLVFEGLARRLEPPSRCPDPRRTSRFVGNAGFGLPSLAA